MGKSKKKNKLDEPTNKDTNEGKEATIETPSSKITDITENKAPQEEPKPLESKRFTRNYFFLQIKEFSIIAAFVLVVIGHVVQGSMVIGDSMRPTFNNGNSAFPDAVIVNKLSWYFQSWDYGNVVILYSPREPKKKLIKRLLGKGGDIVTIHGTKYPVGEGKVLVVGDNLDNSFDGRRFGAIPQGLLQGKVWLQIWPLTPKFISSEMVNKNLIRIEKAITNMKEEDILLEVRSALAKKTRKSLEKILSSTSLFDELKLKNKEIIELLENKFHESISFKEEVSDSGDPSAVFIRKNHIILSNFSMEDLKTPKKIASWLFHLIKQRKAQEKARRG